MEKIVPEALMSCLETALKKSGVRGYEDVFDSIVLHEGADKCRSSVLGEYVLPTDEYPNGRIVLHIDAISSYCDYVGRHVVMVATKILFAQIHNALSYRSKGKFDYKRAEAFATKACNKLVRQRILPQSPPPFYIDPNDKMMIYQVMLRQEWIKKWTGKELDEVAKELNIAE